MKMQMKKKIWNTIFITPAKWQRRVNFSFETKDEKKSFVRKIVILCIRNFALFHNSIGLHVPR